MKFVLNRLVVFYFLSVIAFVIFLGNAYGSANVVTGRGAGSSPVFEGKTGASAGSVTNYCGKVARYLKSSDINDIESKRRSVLRSPKRHTHVSIKGNRFYINGELTYKGKYWNGHKIEGLLLNSRMVQGIFDDLNPKTRHLWAYPDTKAWDPDRNTREFIESMPDWKGHGLMAFTINLQGGSPEGYSRTQPWHNSAIAENGSLRKDYMTRLEMILDKADELGMVVILGIFYFGQDERIRDEKAVIQAVDNTIDWLFKKKYRNVLIEICNETMTRSYDHDILKPARVHELIQRVREKILYNSSYPAGTSFGGGVIPGRNVVKASDFILIHGNGVDNPATILEMIEEVKNLPGYRNQPIVNNEDDNYDFDKPENNFINSIKAYTSWGYFDFRRYNEGFENGFQSVPVDWRINSERKKAFFSILKNITGGAKNHTMARIDPISPHPAPQTLPAGNASFTPVFPGENWKMATPESQGVDSSVLNSALNYFNSSAGGAGSTEMVIVRNGYIIQQGASASAFHTLYSGTKPFTTTVMGLLIQQGVISSINDPAVNYLPGLDDKYPAYAGITFKHLATFTSGYNADAAAVTDMKWGDPRKFLTPLSPLASPGTKFQYNDPAIHQLGNILTVTSGESLENIFKTGIADVIGMKNWQWRHHGYYDNGISNEIVATFLNPSGIYGGGIHITPLDVARFGLLYLNRGTWNGRQVLNSGYVDEATTNQVPLTLKTGPFDRRGNFGYMWYTNGIGANGTKPWPSAPPKSYTFQGNGRNYCFVIPEWNMVIARMSPPDQESMNDKIWEDFFSRLKTGISDFPLPQQVK